METDFQSFIDKNKLCEKTDRILLGVSGGIDSVCMFHLFRLAGYAVGIAHCNFQLRASESEQDELFVQNLANSYDIPYFSVKFNTAEIARKDGISIQMAARDLRYEWFSEIKSKYNYDCIAVAHNKDDVIETFLINLTRGCGIKGLAGIKAKTKEVIRPLLFALKEEIIAYAKTNDIDYREDSSNQSTKYNRNLIRHQIISLFEKINPRFRETMIENIARLKEAEELYLESISKGIKYISHEEGNHLIINIEKLKQLDSINAHLHEIFYPMGFSSSQIKSIMQSLDGISGKQFFSLTHRLIKNRNELIIDEISVEQDKSYYIDANTKKIEEPISINISNFKQSEDFEIIKSNKVGLFDFDKLDFPLTLRKWKKGDYFMPLGMKSLKKLSDFFIDSKLSIATKEKIWILESSNKIIWVIGYRIDERFKINNQTKTVLMLELSDN